MDIVFVRNERCPWRRKDDDGEDSGLVEIDMENRGFFNAVAQRFFNRPRISHISLDRYGSTLWLALDGKNSVNDILSKMHETFPDEKEKMLNRIVHFLNTLEIHRFIVRT